MTLYDVRIYNKDVDSVSLVSKCIPPRMRYIGYNFFGCTGDLLLHTRYVRVLF